MGMMRLDLGLPILLGWLAAFFVNYLADVLPATRKLASPLCAHCAAKTAWRDYLLLQPCRACGKQRSWRTWITQFFGIAFTLYLWLSPPAALGFWRAWILLVYLGVVFIIDLEHRLILHPTSYVGIALAVYIGASIHGIKVSLLGGVTGFGIMFVLYYFGILFARWISKRRSESVIEDGDALGFGDVNLAGILGLLLGYPLVIGGILTAILAGGAISFLLIVGMLAMKRYKAFVAIPYAPFLILSAIWLLYF